MTVADVAIKPFSLSDLEALQAHFGRHRAESGLGGVYFMPFEVNGLDAPRGVVVEKAFIALDQPLWQRWFCAHDAATGRIVGHVDLKGDALHAGLHRCQLGIGIEGPWRRQGLGERLMQTAIAFAREQPSLQWISLSTFAGNTAARALYQRLGFVEEGVLRDRFRLGGQVIDDVQMILSVA